MLFRQAGRQGRCLWHPVKDATERNMRSGEMNIYVVAEFEMKIKT